MPLQKVKPKNLSAAIGGMYSNVRLASNRQPPRSQTADSGYYEGEREHSPFRRQAHPSVQTQASNRGGDQDDEEVAELERETAKAIEASLRQLDETVFDEVEDEQLHETIELSQVTHQEEQEVIAESLRVVQDLENSNVEKKMT